MPNHTEGNGRTGRNVALPDENRPSWRPQDDVNQRNRRMMSEDDDRYDDDRYMRGHWEDRERRDWGRDRDDWRGSERYGQGQSGSAAGRQQDDRSMHFSSRNQGYPHDERERDRGTDERWTGRGGAMYTERGGYGPRGHGYSDSDRPGQGEQRESAGGRGATGQGGMYGQGGYDEGMYGRGGMQHQYGSQGYQGYGGHRGKGPAGYQRSDERIREAVCEALTDDDRVDASGIDVQVKGGEVTLTGTVPERHMKRCAEDVVEGISGIKDVQNQLRVGTAEKKSGEAQGGSKQRS